jgi:hypothetical protein
LNVSLTSFNRSNSSSRPMEKRLFLRTALSSEQLRNINYYKEKKTLFKQVSEKIKAEDAIKGRINNLRI